MCYKTLRSVDHIYSKMPMFLEKQKAGHLCSYAQVNFLE